MTEGSVLIVDDDADFLEVLSASLASRGFTVVCASSLEGAKEALSARAFGAALVDLDLGPQSGLDVIPVLRESAGAASVIAMSGRASVSSAVEAMRRGAFEFLEKPFPTELLLATLGRALERSRLARENATLRSLVAAPRQAIPVVAPELLGSAMREVYATAERAAKLDVPVLITGETGTGKEFVARAIHAASPRAKGPWIAVNCGGFQRDLIDSELFGHEKGAFTGARDLRLGLIEVARGGTLFLDEIGELPPEAQAKLLRFIELGEFRRVGSSETLGSDVRVVAATNRDLEAEVAAGRFRKDLRFRLDVVSIQIPPLRERRDEITVFVEAFLAARGRTERAFPAPVMEALRAFDWPGNLRELRNVVDRLLVKGDVGKAEVQDLRRLLPQAPPTAAPSLDASGDLTLAGTERRHITSVLQLVAWNRREAATRLGIDPRTLYRKIREYRIAEPAP